MNAKRFTLSKKRLGVTVRFCLASAAMACAAALAAARPPSPATRPADAAQRRQVEARLAQKIKSLSVDEIDLADHIQFLSDVSQQNIIVRWNALATVGVHRNTQIALGLKNMTVRDVLLHVLAKAGGSEPLVFTIEGDDVIVTTRSDLPNLQPAAAASRPASASSATPAPTSAPATQQQADDARAAEIVELVPPDAAGGNVVLILWREKTP